MHISLSVIKVRQYVELALKNVTQVNPTAFQ